MTAYDRWLELTFQEQCRQEEFLEERVNELMMGVYNPYTAKNIVEAISEECLFSKEGDIEQLADLMERREVTMLGRMVFGRIVDYWERQAEEHAIEDWDKGNRD
jgi:hypothetical protein